MKRLFMSVAALAVAGGAVGLWLTAPSYLPQKELAGLIGDVERGETLFWAGGCASCHAAPGSSAEAHLVLAGGKGFASDFGTFYAPNISPDPENGIGTWSASDLANAMLKGVSPDGKHYYPAFPYTSYARIAPQDAVDIHAFLQTLPESDVASVPHDVGFPFNIRRSLGGWKLLFGDDDFVVTGDLNDQQIRGRYLVEGLGHCSECHSPRNALGGIDKSKWLAGAPNPSGRGKIPNITPAALDWSQSDVVEYLTSGFTPDFDSAGGEMAEVVENMAKLPIADREAIAAYLAIVPSIDG